MPLTPIAGVQRLRAMQIGKESTFGTQVAATRRVPYSFMPTLDPHVTYPTAEVGALSPAIAPYRTGEDVTGQATGILFANEAPYLFSAGLKGNVSSTGGGAAKTWTYQPADLTQDVYDTYTVEWSDDATGDGFAYTGGIIDRLQLGYPQDLGPITVQADWRFAGHVYPQTPTAALQVDPAPTPFYAADTALYLDSTSGSMGITQIVSSMHDATVTINNATDVKRFANGSNTRFKVAGYGRGPRLIEATFTFAKSTAAIAEATKWLNESPQERFLGLDTTSTVMITGSTPYQQTLRFAGFWFTRSNPTVGTNTAIQLVMHGFLDQTLTYPIKATVVNSLGSL